MSKHTPLPWLPGKDSQLFGRNGEQVLTWNLPIGQRMYRDPTAEANADFIVRACNTHELLISACKDALSDLRWIESISLKSDFRASILKLIVAIDTAEGSTK